MLSRAFSFRRSAFNKKHASTLSLQAKSQKPKTAPGFTLIELMVVLAIMIMISLLIFTSTTKFNSAILLRSLAYQVGLSIREAQLYGIAVHDAPNGNQAPCKIGGTSSFCSSYGVHFDKTTPQSYLVFADTSADGLYEASGPKQDSIVDPFSTHYGFTVSNFCVGNGQNVSCSNGCPTDTSALTDLGFGNCPNGLSNNKLSTVDITFTRPDPDAHVAVTGSAGIVNPPYVGAYIIVSSPGGSTRSISVSQTGQIVVTATGN